jgi:branched-subunit amino acid aminotransferase/4-amino-4-deoxychorismate lyase
VVALEDRGFRYGQHFFATVAVRHGRPHRWEAHLQRLRADGEAAGFHADPLLWRKLASGPPDLGFKDGTLRLYWTAGPGAPAAPPTKGAFYLWWEPQALPAESVPVVVAWGATPLVSPGPGWKTGNYWARLLECQKAQALGAGEVLLFSPEGFLASAGLANVFFRIDGCWWTPPVGDGARPGVTRLWLLEQGWAREKRLPRADWNSVEALALANSRTGPVPVAGFAATTPLPSAWSPEKENWADLWQTWAAS